MTQQVYIIMSNGFPTKVYTEMLPARSWTDRKGGEIVIVPMKVCKKQMTHKPAEAVRRRK